MALKEMKMEVLQKKVDVKNNVESSKKKNGRVKMTIDGKFRKETENESENVKYWKVTVNM